MADIRSNIKKHVDDSNKRDNSTVKPVSINKYDTDPLSYIRYSKDEIMNKIDSVGNSMKSQRDLSNSNYKNIQGKTSSSDVKKAMSNIKTANDNIKKSFEVKKAMYKAVKYK